MSRAIVWEKMADLSFHLFKVSSGFNLKSNFSSVDLDLVPYPSTRDPSSGYAVLLSQLFEFNKDTLHSPDKSPDNLKEPILQVVKFLKRCRSIPWSPFSATPVTKEEQIMVHIAHYILVGLCSEVTLEKRYSKRLGAHAEEIQSTHIGIGSINTWHGTPDGRVRGCNIVFPGTDEEDASSRSSEGNTTPLEAKLSIKLWTNISQLVSTCVTSSFTEHNLHPRKNTLVPTILIDANVVQVCLYDCEHDVLLVSQQNNICNSGRLSTTGAFFIWLTINHRYEI